MVVYQTPEQRARENIDNLLNKSGWIVQDKDKIDWSKGPGIAIREYQTEAGPADYVLFVDQKAVGIIEAKREDQGHRLTVHEEQAEYYAKSRLKYINNKEKLPFVYESTGVLTRFTDLRDPKSKSRPVFSFHRPKNLLEWNSENKTLRERIKDLPNLITTGLRDCQKSAIRNGKNLFL